MNSPSVVFTDDQALMADKGTLYSGTSDEAASSITSINHDDIIENSQPESQVLYVGGKEGCDREKGKQQEGWEKGVSRYSGPSVKGLDTYRN